MNVFYKFNEVSLADSKILFTDVDNDNKSIIFLVSSVYNIKTKQIINKLIIFVYSWKDFRITKYVSHQPFVANDTIILSLSCNIETFKFIQEVKLEDATLAISGFSKESGSWMTYKFLGAKYKILELA